jgi:glycosyltransferase involved in cell wall biosynthesis
MSAEIPANGHIRARASARRLSLAWVVPGRLDQLTGGYLYDTRVIRGLRDAGHDVRSIELPTGFHPLDPIGAWRLGRALAARRWDAVIVDELAHPSMALALPADRLSRARRARARRPAPVVVALVHHLRCSEPRSRLASGLTALVERAALAAVDLVICTSRSTAATVKRVAPPRATIEVVPPGCDFHFARPSDVGARPDRPDRRPLRLLAVAHWTPRKRIVELLRALALVRTPVELDLVGDPDRDPAYARRVRAELRRPALIGRVRVHGRVSSDRLASLYAAAGAMALASSHEGYGTVLAEAVACGLPIVATRVGAVPEVIRDGLEGDLVPPGDVAAFARALERLARDPVERRRRAACALERAATLPTWAESCLAFNDILERAVTGPSPLGVLPNGSGLGTMVAQLNGRSPGSGAAEFSGPRGEPRWPPIGG